ncbi:MAG: hypothetical protein QM755_17210 [Luteolibacter sp.]
MKAILPWVCTGILGLGMLATGAPSTPAGVAGNGTFRSRIIEKLRGLRSELNLTDAQREQVRQGTLLPSRGNPQPVADRPQRS